MPKNFLQIYWKTIVLCVIIFVLSSVPFKSIPDVAKFQYSDKFTHLLMYATLGFVAYFEYSRDSLFKNKYKSWFIYLAFFLISFGGLIEILQGTLFKPRTSEFADWLSDIVGLIIGFLFARFLFRNTTDRLK
ncbi:MAG: VanZ family protein [Paludibacteraceae bacterium]